MKELKSKRKPLSMYNIRTRLSKIRVLYLQQDRPITITNFNDNLTRIFELEDNEITMYNNGDEFIASIQLAIGKTLNIVASLRSLSYRQDGSSTFLANTITAKVVEVV